MPEHKFYGVEFQNSPIDYYTWGCPLFVLEPPLQRSSRTTQMGNKSEDQSLSWKLPFHVGYMDLVLNTRTGHVSPQNHVVFDNTIYTMGHMIKGTVQGNLKNWYRSTQSLLRRNTSLLQNSGILTNPQSCPYPERPHEKTRWNQVPNICLQGLIPRMHPSA